MPPPPPPVRGGAAIVLKAPPGSGKTHDALSRALKAMNTGTFSRCIVFCTSAQVVRDILTGLLPRSKWGNVVVYHSRRMTNSLVRNPHLSADEAWKKHKKTVTIFEYGQVSALLGASGAARGADIVRQLEYFLGVGEYRQHDGGILWVWDEAGNMPAERRGGAMATRWCATKTDCVIAADSFVDRAHMDTFLKERVGMKEVVYVKPPPRTGRRRRGPNDPPPFRLRFVPPGGNDNNRAENLREAARIVVAVARAGAEEEEEEEEMRNRAVVLTSRINKRQEKVREYMEAAAKAAGVRVKFVVWNQKLPANQRGKVMAEFELDDDPRAMVIIGGPMLTVAQNFMGGAAAAVVLPELIKVAPGLCEERLVNALGRFDRGNSRHTTEITLFAGEPLPPAAAARVRDACAVFGVAWPPPPKPKPTLRRADVVVTGPTCALTVAHPVTGEPVAGGAVFVEQWTSPPPPEGTEFLVLVGGGRTVRARVATGAEAAAAFRTHAAFLWACAKQEWGPLDAAGLFALATAARGSPPSGGDGLVAMDAADGREKAWRREMAREARRAMEDAAAAAPGNATVFLVEGARAAAGTKAAAALAARGAPYEILAAEAA